MIFALALAVRWISIPSAAGLVLVDNAVILANEVLLRDGSAPAASDSLGELLGVADSRSRVRSRSTCNPYIACTSEHVFSDDADPLASCQGGMLALAVMEL